MKFALRKFAPSTFQSRISVTSTAKINTAKTSTVKTSTVIDLGKLPVAKFFVTPLSVVLIFVVLSYLSALLLIEVVVPQNTEANAQIQDRENNTSIVGTEVAEIIGLFKSEESASEFIVVFNNGLVSSWNLSSGQNRVLLPKGEIIAACDYHRTKNLLVVSHDTNSSIFNLRNGRRVFTSSDFGTKASVLKFAPDGESVLIGGEDGKVYRWKYLVASEGDNQSIKVERYVGHSASVTALVYHPFNRMFFSADSFGTLAAWLSYDKDLFQGGYDDAKKTVGSFYIEDSPRGLGAVVDNTTVLGLEISKNGQNIFAALQDGRVEWKLVRGLKTVVVGQTNSGALFDIKLSPDNNKLATVARDGLVKVWRLKAFDTPGEVFKIRDSVPSLNTVTKDSLGYFELIKEFSLLDARKLLFLSENIIIVAEQNGRLLELKL